MLTKPSQIMACETCNANYKFSKRDRFCSSCGGKTVILPPLPNSHQIKRFRRFLICLSVLFLTFTIGYLSSQSTKLENIVSYFRKPEVNHVSDDLIHPLVLADTFDPNASLNDDFSVDMDLPIFKIDKLDPSDEYLEALKLIRKYGNSAEFFNFMSTKRTYFAYVNNKPVIEVLRDLRHQLNERRVIIISFFRPGFADMMSSDAWDGKTIRNSANSTLPPLERAGQILHEVAHAYGWQHGDLNSPSANNSNSLPYAIGDDFQEYVKLKEAGKIKSILAKQRIRRFPELKLIGKESGQKQFIEAVELLYKYGGSEEFFNFVEKKRKTFSHTFGLSKSEALKVFRQQLNNDRVFTVEFVRKKDDFLGQWDGSVINLNTFHKDSSYGWANTLFHEVAHALSWTHEGNSNTRHDNINSFPYAIGEDFEEFLNFKIKGFTPSKLAARSKDQYNYEIEVDEDSPISDDELNKIAEFAGNQKLNKRQAMALVSKIEALYKNGDKRNILKILDQSRYANSTEDVNKDLLDLYNSNI